MVGGLRPGTRSAGRDDDVRGRELRILPGLPADAAGFGISAGDRRHRSGVS
jgi:hypothetical protein